VSGYSHTTVRHFGAVQLEACTNEVNLTSGSYQDKCRQKVSVSTNDTPGASKRASPALRGLDVVFAVLMIIQAQLHLRALDVRAAEGCLKKMLQNRTGC
jgi:hypothetical protein